MRKFISIFCAAALLAGCATGQKFALSRASHVRVGMSTDELVQVMGSQPFTIAPVEADLDGNLVTSPYRAGFPTGLDRWIWWYDSGGKRETAAFVVGDSKVVQAASAIARSKAEMRQQLAQATAELNLLIAERRTAEAAAKKKAAQDKKAEFVRSHSELSEQVRQCVLDGRVCIGMPADALEVSWGRPRHKQKTTVSFGTSETWSYGFDFGGPSVFLDNGKVSGWHTSE